MSDSFLRMADVRRRVALSTSTVYARMAAGDFPQVRRDGGIAFWLESEIDAYIEAVKARASVGPRMGRRVPANKKAA
jgi:prophage regulatory protein